VGFTLLARSPTVHYLTVMKLIGSDEAITLLIASNGNSTLAAAKAKTELGLDISEPLLLAAIASDPTAPTRLYQAMQTMIALQGFDALRKTKLVFTEKLPLMSPDSVGRVYERMLNTVSGMIKVDSSDGSKNMAARFSELLAGLPEEVREAVEALVETEDQYMMEALVNSEGEPEGPCEEPILHPELAIG
jgi:hypothetical protein